MEIFLFAADYLAWHYTQALSDMIAIGGNFLWIIHSSFSVPARKVYERVEKGTSKTFAAILCFFVILAGLVVLSAALLAECAILLFWLALPLILILLLALALRIILPAS